MPFHWTRLPSGKVDHILASDFFSITLSQQCFKHYADRERQASQVRETLFFKLIQPEISVAPMGSLKFSAGIELIAGHTCSFTLDAKIAD
jgi:hypothetical protein